MYPLSINIFSFVIIFISLFSGRVTQNHNSYLQRLVCACADEELELFVVSSCRPGELLVEDSRLTEVEKNSAKSPSIKLVGSAQKKKKRFAC